MEKLFWGYTKCPIGLLEIGATATALVAVNFVEERREDTGHSAVRPNGIVETTRVQLRAYFAGERQAFDLPLAPSGTEFQQAVWKQLRAIPFGQTVSYSDIAQRIDQPQTVRAVGGANGKNPLPIIVPCHRVIGRNGKLTGYAGGLWRKEWLLKHERVAI